MYITPREHPLPPIAEDIRNRVNSNTSTRSGESAGTVGSTNSILTTGVATATVLTPAQRCASAGADMDRCIAVSQIDELEKQAAVACRQCDQIRTQIADLRRQIAPSTAPVAPAPTAATLRYGKPASALTSADVSTLCSADLPALKSYTAGVNGPVANENYKRIIRPIVDKLSKDTNPQSKVLRDQLKAFDPPGAIMRALGRRAKNKSGLSAIASQISAMACPSPIAGPLTADQALQRNLAAKAAADRAAANAARKQREAAEYATGAQKYAAGITNTAAAAAAAARNADAKARETLTGIQASAAATLAEKQRLANIQRRAREANAIRARIIAEKAAAENLAARNAANAAVLETVGKMDGGARRRRASHKRRVTRRHRNTRKQRR